MDTSVRETIGCGREEREGRKDNLDRAGWHVDLPLLACRWKLVRDRIGSSPFTFDCPPSELNSRRASSPLPTTIIFIILPQQSIYIMYSCHVL
jgi:hypothetical protein